MVTASSAEHGKGRLDADDGAGDVVAVLLPSLAVKP
jgi:hypothetical protein